MFVLKNIENTSCSRLLGIFSASFQSCTSSTLLQLTEKSAPKSGSHVLIFIMEQALR